MSASEDAQVLILKGLSSDITEGNSILIQGINSSSAKYPKGPDVPFFSKC